MASVELMRHNSVICIATAYGLDGRGVGVQVPVGSRIFIPPYCPDQLWGPPNLLSSGYWGALSVGGKRQGYEADHSLPTSRKRRSIHPLPHIWHSAYLSKHRDNFTFFYFCTSKCKVADIWIRWHYGCQLVFIKHSMEYVTYVM
jgi:hypothetical protein